MCSARLDCRDCLHYQAMSQLCAFSSLKILRLKTGSISVAIIYVETNAAPLT